MWQHSRKTLIISESQSGISLSIRFKGTLWNFLVNKQKFSVTLQKVLCLSLSSNKCAECISFLTAKCCNVSGPALFTPVFFAAFLGTLLPPVDQCDREKQLVGLCIVLSAYTHMHVRQKNKKGTHLLNNNSLEPLGHKLPRVPLKGNSICVLFRVFHLPLSC